MIFNKKKFIFFLWLFVIFFKNIYSLNISNCELIWTSTEQGDYQVYICSEQGNQIDNNLKEKI